MFWHQHGIARPRRSMLAAVAMFITLVAVMTVSASAQPMVSSAKGAKFDQALHDSLPESIKAAGVLTLGAVWETPPIISVNLANPSTPVGIAPELAAAMGKVLGVAIRWQNLAWPAQLPGLQAGNVDALFGQVSATAQRERSIVDLIPFQKSGYGLLTAAGNPLNLAKLTDLCGVAVGVPIGSSTGTLIKNVSQTKCVSAGKPAIKYREFNGATAAVQALRGESIGAWFDGAPSVVGIATANPGTFSSVIVRDDNTTTEYSCIAVAKQNPKLTTALAEALKRVISDGSYAAVYAGIAGMSGSALTPDKIVINPITHTPVGEKL